MASEYLKWKFRDVQPEQAAAPLRGKARLANWFHYYKWWVVAGVVLVWIVGGMLWNALGVGQVRPDYTFAYIGANALPADTAAALERELAALGQDVNGDGKVVVRLNQYPTSQNETDPLQTSLRTQLGIHNQANGADALLYGSAADIQLLADITDGDSYFFLTEFPANVQKAYFIFAGTDGALPEDGDFDIEGRAYLWADCPVLSGLELGMYEETVLGETFTGDSQTLLSGLYIGRRGYYDESQNPYLAQDEAFWVVLTEGATS